MPLPHYFDGPGVRLDTRPRQSGARSRHSAHTDSSQGRVLPALSSVARRGAAAVVFAMAGRRVGRRHVHAAGVLVVSRGTGRPGAPAAFRACVEPQRRPAAQRYRAVDPHHRPQFPRNHRLPGGDRLGNHADRAARIVAGVARSLATLCTDHPRHRSVGSGQSPGAPLGAQSAVALAIPLRTP